MSIVERINQELLAATKNRDKERLSIIRLIRSALQNRQIDKRAELTDEEALQVLSSLVKKAKESIEQFEKGNRPDLAQKERRELEIILSFMPEQLGEDELRAQLDSIIAQVGAKGPQDLGLVMKVAMERLKGRADGKMVNQVARELLASKKG
jgi:uncharacterized protein YqeY